MTEPHDLILDHLSAIRSELAELPRLRSEMREGFATQRAHYAVSHGDQALLERRLIEIEQELDRVKRRLGLQDDK